MKALLIVLCLIAAKGSMPAQVSAPERSANQRFDRPVFGFGLSAGPVTGFGFSFRENLPAEIAFQLIGGIIKVDEKLHYNVGGEVQIDFPHGGEIRAFVAVGAGFFYSGTGGENDLNGPLRIGAGFGVERGMPGGISLTGEILLTYFSDGTILPLPQAGVHYYF